MTIQPTDAHWFSWIEVQTKATETWAEGDLAGAIRLIDSYLEGKVLPDLQRRAVAFRGDLHEENGEQGAAMADFRLAHELSEKPDYERYTLELSLGGLSETLGDLNAADYWYVKALETASADATISAGSGLLRLLKLRRGRSLDEKEHRLVEKVLQQSWNLLQVEGKPDFANLEMTAKKLVAAQGQQ